METKLQGLDLGDLVRNPYPTGAAGTHRSGTQSLGRGIKLMRMIASKPEFGWRLSDLAAASQHDKATVHRMLACMIEERLVEQRSGDRHYIPGPLMYELGLAHPARVQFRCAAEEAVSSFSRRMGGIGLLLLRSGSEYVCSVRVGTLALPGLMVNPGTRRPLFTSAGGIAIVQTLPEDEAVEVLSQNVMQEVTARGASRLGALQAMRERSARHGFGVNLGDVVAGVHAFAVPVRDSGNNAFAALCLMGTAMLYGEERLPEIHEELKAQAAGLAEVAHVLQL